LWAKALAGPGGMRVSPWDPAHLIYEGFSRLGASHRQRWLPAAPSGGWRPHL